MTTLGLSQIRFVGTDLRRPECVLATARGQLFASDARGGILRIGPDGAQERIGHHPDLLPNGIALQADGSFLVANLHGAGGVWRLDAAGGARPVLTEVDGVPLAAVNFVRLDREGRVWISANPPLGTDGRYRTERQEGFLALLDGGGARIVADGIGWANECLVSASDRHLYVNETFGRRLSRFDLAPDGSLSRRSVVATFGAGTYPDGIGEDEAGAIWVVSVASNRVIRVAPDGRDEVVIEDSDEAHLAALEEAYLAHRLTRSALTGPTGAILKNVTSIAFGGPDRRTAHLGSIAGDRFATFRVPTPGVEPVHWCW